ncbi:MAG: glycosyltransferase [Acidimicrobiia bacterium]|nr:glycosyltransferase [Acidimicrobiia bacterium]
MISVVLPAFNESGMLDATVAAIHEGFTSRKISFEIQIVENGSTDETNQIAEQICSRLPEVSTQSLGYADYGEALRAGLKSSVGEVAIIFDVDYFDLDFADSALEVLDWSANPTGPVVVVGSKRAPGSSDNRSRLRRLATAIFSGILRRQFGLSLSDTHGMKVLNLGALRGVIDSCQCGADLFDTEVIIRAERAGMIVSEVPVDVTELRPSRTSILRRVPRTLGGIVRLRRVLGPVPKD